MPRSSIPRAKHNSSSSISFFVGDGFIANSCCLLGGADAPLPDRGSQDASNDDNALLSTCFYAQTPYIVSSLVSVVYRWTSRVQYRT
jgi:hypothetical protein